MITEKEALEYEVGRTSLIGSWIYLLFPKIFEIVFKRAYKRYQFFMETKDQLWNTNLHK